MENKTQEIPQRPVLRKMPSYSSLTFTEQTNTNLVNLDEDNRHNEEYLVNIEEDLAPDSVIRKLLNDQASTSDNIDIRQLPNEQRSTSDNIKQFESDRYFL